MFLYFTMGKIFPTFPLFVIGWSGLPSNTMYRASSRVSVLNGTSVCLAVFAWHRRTMEWSVAMCAFCIRCGLCREYTGSRSSTDLFRLRKHIFDDQKNEDLMLIPTKDVTDSVHVDVALKVRKIIGLVRLLLHTWWLFLVVDASKFSI